MNDTPAATITAAEKKANLKHRMMVAAVLSAVFGPMLVAYVMFKLDIGLPDTTVNKGELITPPLSINELQLQQFDGSSWLQSEQTQKWRMVIPAVSCQSDCQQSLWLTRQVRTRLGKDSHRIERILLLSNGALSTEAKLLVETEHPGLVVLKASDYERWLGESALATVTELGYYIVDQNGWAMMSYNAKQSGNDVLKDIKKLLRYSYDD